MASEQDVYKRQMQPDVKNHYIKVNKKHKRLLEQMFHFPMGAHDDGPSESGTSVPGAVYAFC